MSVAGGRGEEAEAQTETYAQGNPGVEQLSPEHCLVLAPKALGYLILLFRSWSVGLSEVALLGMALGERCAHFGPQLPHV